MCQQVDVLCQHVDVLCQHVDILCLYDYSTGSPGALRLPQLLVLSVICDSCCSINMHHQQRVAVSAASWDSSSCYIHDRVTLC